MSDIDTIKHLRDTTGLSFGQIKKALEEAGGDQVRAMEILKAHGLEVAEKKSSRQVKEGIIEAYIHSTKKIGVLLELLCETDFVARNVEFQKLAHEIAMQIAAVKPGTLDDLLAQPYIKNQDIAVKDLISETIAKLGENIQIGRFDIFEI